ncbi:MAG TPA: acetyl-CoA carboxylase biotin carboxyl carrier protein [Gemmatimonadaceae bacterium]|nr:acetyl-CoA carboxylase biotin carboxyl carrier protein [Gemmatimonadaceae bacterium]
MIDLRYVKKLIELLDGSSVDSIEISSDKGMKIRLSKSPSQRGAVQVAAPVPVPMLAAPAAPAARLTPAEGVATQPADDGGKPEPPKPKLLEIKSPMVGTFYASPEPGAKAYVSEGQRIARGQMVCIIEAMKIMNEIESEFAGVVKDVMVQDSHPVEYGQVLFRIDPNG